MNVQRLFFLCLCAVIFLFSAVATGQASAGKGGNGHGHDKQHGQSEKHQFYNGGHESHARDTNIVVKFGDTDRTIIHNFLASDFRANCPPGLAKKHNGCLPPGQAKKRYVVGQILPSGIIPEPLPHALVLKLQSPPLGYKYVSVDKDVLLVSEASHKVIDAITLLSAVGK